MGHHERLHRISKSQTTNLAEVAPGIAEALMPTAMGLVAAIPAVMIYNMFAARHHRYRGLLGDGSAELMRMVSRDLNRAEMMRAGHGPRSSSWARRFSKPPPTTR